MTESEARAMFREYLIEGCFLTDDDIDRIYADPARLLPEWQAWLQQTQIENDFVTEAETLGWTP